MKSLKPNCKSELILHMDVKRSFTIIMPKAELRAYVLQNPEDNEAF
ncbi:MAG: DUF6887 family protein [Nostoc sp.]